MSDATTSTVATGAVLNNKFLEDLPAEQRSEKAIFLKADQVSSIGNLSEYSHTRNLTLNFNNLGNLRGLEQMPMLRKLSAYCCALRTFDDLSGNGRLESLSLQQNYIRELAFCLRSMNKLRRLRVDKNDLKSIENLHCCTALRYLDLSYNKIESLDGIAGLQNLSELKITNNKIRSLRGLSSLPSLLEIHIDDNLLSSLSGIQNIPTLEILHASRNQITTLLIPQTYTHKGSLENSDSKGKPRSNASGVISASGGSTVTEKPKLGMAKLTELELHGNLISDLEGLGTLGDSVELLDISSNQLKIIESLEALTIYRNLRDLSVGNNPFFISLSPMREGQVLKSVAKMLLSSCEKLDSLDGISLQVLLPKVKPKVDNSIPEADIFKTWENNTDGAESVEVYDDGDDSDSDLEIGPRQELEAMLESQRVLSKEEIEATENVFKNLISATKEILRGSLSSLDVPAKKVPFVRMRPSLLHTALSDASAILDTSVKTEEPRLNSPEYVLNEAEAFVAKVTKPRLALASDENVSVSHRFNQLEVTLVPDNDPQEFEDDSISSPKKSARPFSANDSLSSKPPSRSNSTLENKSQLRFDIYSLYSLSNIIGSCICRGSYGSYTVFVSPYLVKHNRFF